MCGRCSAKSDGFFCPAVFAVDDPLAARHATPRNQQTQLPTFIPCNSLEKRRSSPAAPAASARRPPRLAREGADVALVGRHEDDDARQTLRAIQALGRRAELLLADCAKPADCTRVVEETARRLGGVDVLIHSAGGPVNGGLLELTPEAWHSAFDVHVHAIFYLCRAAIPLMRPKHEGAVILISSTAGKLATPSHIAYQAVKGAIPTSRADWRASSHPTTSA